MKHTVFGSLVREILFEKDGNRISKLKLWSILSAAAGCFYKLGYCDMETLKVALGLVGAVLGVPGVRDAVPRTKPD